MRDDLNFLTMVRAPKAVESRTKEAVDTTAA
jgi:hypothetical protein